MSIPHLYAWLAAAATVTFWPAIALADAAAAPQEIARGRARAIMLAALAGLAILGFGLVALVWLGARFTHRYRYGGTPLAPTPRPGEHDWAKKPLGATKNSAHPTSDS